MLSKAANAIPDMDVCGFIANCLWLHLQTVSQIIAKVCTVSHKNA